MKNTLSAPFVSHTLLSSRGREGESCTFVGMSASVTAAKRRDLHSAFLDVTSSQRVDDEAAECRI